MASKQKSTKQEFIPGSLSESSDIFDFPFMTDETTIDFLKDHGRIMFIIRGPPGTGKVSLSEMLIDQFPTATVCSADAYFENTFSTQKREREALRQSHEFCHAAVETACQSDDHPIIVKNTHMKRFELQTYLNFAAQYNYTVIMAVTLHKFKVTPEILAKSNTKGLSVEYFKRRLKQWEEVIPVCVGWFPNQEDMFHLLNELQKALDALLGDGKFCRVMNMFDKAELLMHYKARMLLYSIAACEERTDCYKLRGYYLSEKVQEDYGKCFTTTILGYLVTPSFICAVVHLNDTQKALRQKQERNKPKSDGIDSLVKSLNRLELENKSIESEENLKQHTKTTHLGDKFVSLKTTAMDKVCSDDRVINVDDCGCMLLAETGGTYHHPKEVLDSFLELMNGGADENGEIRSDQLIELEENMRAYRFPNDAWLIKPPYDLSFTTVFTGLYV
ncbi:hypothetical protein JTE90_026306 [Oedothorax gibbosus]|uniref:2',3'-cyclic-nucleotide 3'-phosphodiesterase n=1 Tax=Oedothorax gibbosus TaxID=931172 RepID=A0AAV6U629_9ARAC|nr:hypothetical protein JTE90_026306 [Oedothorax gibbosus]